MINLSKQINEIIKEQLSNINEKINGPVLLEILKYKIIDNLKNNINLNSETIVDQKEEFNIEDQSRKINFKLISFKSPFINLNPIIKDNQLILSLNEVLKIDIENTQTKKSFSYKCIPMTGIILSEHSKCSIKYTKNSIVLELNLVDKKLNIENQEVSTI